MSRMNMSLLGDAVAYADQWVSNQQERRDLPGAVVAVWCAGQLLLAKGYGFADLEQRVPMTPKHIFRIASHSKTSTATAIMQLVERKALRLDDRLADYIPWLPQVAGLAEVTIRQTLNHSAGIVRDGRDADHWQLDHTFPDLAGLRDLAENGGLIQVANDSFKYSNIGYGLLGLVIEAASGESYHDYVKHHIIGRLGLVDTGPELDDHARSRLATGYNTRRFGRSRRPFPHVDTHALASATGFYSTAEDLCRYAAAHLPGDDTLLTDPSKREMQQPYWKARQTDRSYGLGLVVGDQGERRLVGHSGGFPGFITQTMFDPKDRLVVVVLTNDSGGHADALMRGIFALIDFGLRQSISADTPSAFPRERFTGRFVNAMGVTDVVGFGDALYLLSADADDPTLTAARLSVVDGDTLRIDDAPGFASRGEAIRYTRDGSGNVMKVVDGGISAYPLHVYLERTAADLG
jgi:D-alanyl-D-alanine carboxypeptidase